MFITKKKHNLIVHELQLQLNEERFVNSTLKDEINALKNRLENFSSDNLIKAVILRLEEISNIIEETFALIKKKCKQ